MIEGECHDCGRGYESLNMHWALNGDCFHPPISDEKIDILTGLVMGDGSIHGRDPRRNRIVQVGMINKEFLDWLDDKMGWISNGVAFRESAADVSRRARESGFSPTAREENYHDVYGWRSISHPDLNHFEEWYDGSEKSFPEDLELNPTIAKYWYVSDGSLSYGDRGRPSVRFNSHLDEVEVEPVLSLFREHGFDPSFHRHGVWFGVDDSEEILRWMGDPPKGFEYKWETDRDRYKTLVTKAYE